MASVKGKWADAYRKKWTWDKRDLGQPLRRLLPGRVPVAGLHEGREDRARGAGRQSHADRSLGFPT